MISAMNPQMRQVALRQPRQVLDQFALFQKIASEAEKAKLDEQSPYREQIADARRQILVNAQVNAATSQVEVSSADQKKFYDGNKARYTGARAKVIFISQTSVTKGLVDQQVTATRSPEQSLELANEIVSKLAKGEDFVGLAKQYSDDAETSGKGADFPDLVRPTSATVPQNIRDAILASKAGDIVGPLRHDTGYYVFRIDSIEVIPYDMVKDEIYKELKDLGLRAWLDQTKAGATVVIENEAYFQPRPAAKN